MGWMLLLSLTLVACGGRAPTVGLKIDLYLHPDSADENDVLLQAAIRQRLAKDESTRKSLIHVRVFQKTVFLSGTVKSGLKDRAGRIANETTVTVNGITIRGEEVKNLIEEKS
ncbi:MAG: BON domain-containing protein [Acidobacteriota bacterium]